MKNIIIFASGSGTNAEQIIKYFSDSDSIKVVGVYSNRENAYVLERAKKWNIPALYFTRDDLYISNAIYNKLEIVNPDLIVLAGFLWKIPEKITQMFPKRIINIHPALLPKYGGKGMYGDHVHQAVVQNKEKESGITIHYVNENYDEGAIIMQARCAVSPTDTAESLAEKIHILEHKYFPQTIAQILHQY